MLSHKEPARLFLFKSEHYKLFEFFKIINGPSKNEKHCPNRTGVLKRQKKENDEKLYVEGTMTSSSRGLNLKKVKR